ncbi:MAG: 3-oxoacyl-[acyl-carrier-protein] reductase [Eubacteriales bacterium]|nr:3-oxoacyl-[acyl-carrier-protein] reductase [Eubacteriales bacterium]
MAEEKNRPVALVTGAGRGIGRAIACRLGAEGYHVIVNYNGSRQAAEATVEEILAAGGKATARQCSVADQDACREMFEEIRKEYGPVAVLVNNAGITKDGLLMAMSEADFDSVIDTNLKGSFHCIKYAAKQMLKARKGRIVNIASVSGILGNAGQANYAASKAGLIGLTKSAARELALRGITVNAVAPGFIETDMTAVLDERVRKAAVDQIPLQRFGTPEDVAGAVAFLCSDQAAYITGQVLAVDGGMAM